VPVIHKHWEEVSADRWQKLAEAWLAEIQGDNSYEQSELTGVVVHMSFTASPEIQWNFILVTVSLAETDEELAAIAAGPIERLLGTYGENYIELVEKQAVLDPKFARALTGVLRYDMSDDIWSRIELEKQRALAPINSRTRETAHDKRLIAEELALTLIDDELERRGEKPEE